ncbi:hypothetical protein LY76DRAFT_323293 [Colletotrichum caudatum]|nr:hypothetical protein LY76DRAFT_323293 [Colletotrichum caudatum]
MSVVPLALSTRSSVRSLLLAALAPALRYASCWQGCFVESSGSLLVQTRIGKAQRERSFPAGDGACVCFSHLSFLFFALQVNW